MTKVGFTFALGILLLLLSGCSSQQPIQGQHIQSLVLAEPLDVDYRSQIKLERINGVLAQANLADEQRAVIHYERGVLYDSMGLNALAHFDFNQAIRLRPNLANAYNFMGIQKTVMQQFSAAYEDFDAVIDLEPDHPFAYLNRGIALHYGGRNNLASKDMLQFYHIQPSDPYRILWLYIVEREVDAELALQRLKTSVVDLDQQQWTTDLIEVFIGGRSEDDFLKTLGANVNNNAELASQLCEAYFYLGKLNQYQGNSNKAANYYKLALSTNMYEYVEYRMSRLELDLMVYSAFEHGHESVNE